MTPDTGGSAEQRLGVEHVGCELDRLGNYVEKPMTVQDATCFAPRRGSERGLRVVCDTSPCCAPSRLKGWCGGSRLRNRR
jgi:hypothetical protein